ncbi:hypothetical protein FZC84_19405 [Rossellomorea vietnamensis]|uniref:Uncharacterized protein n=1 Tax=Rossellomorea vietnamensis TaxID=218284 RepID=A0A5D4M8U6_9BACI|nr:MULTISPECIES: hypothetical protein [Bacillaceae]TYR97400.1 hypothetical protein FZC84_19405 [Rossellomorea vietnamensis]
MFVISAILLIFTLPGLWVIWTAADVTSGKREKIEWKKPLILLFILLGISALLSLYFYNSYHLPFWPTLFEHVVGLIITGVFLLILSIINIVVSITYKDAPKSFHNPKALWIFIGVLCMIFLLLFLWIIPFAQKTSYVNKIQVAMNALEEEEKNKEEMTVLFMSSEQECVRRRTNSCAGEEYENTFFVKNNLDEEKEVQVRIRALDSDKNELKIVESEIMTLDAGELRLVETEETSDNSSVWSRSSFQTEYRTHFYQSIFRFRDVE